MIPARKFSPISRRAKPMINAVIPAPASILAVTPPRSRILKEKRRPVIKTTNRIIVVRNSPVKGLPSAFSVSFMIYCVSVEKLSMPRIEPVAP